MIKFEDGTSLSLLYHLNSEPWLNDEAYRGAAYHQEFKEVDAPVARTTLPEAPASAVVRLAAGRQSCRAYRTDPMPLATVSALTMAAYGIVQIAPLAGQGSFLRRTVPSAGGLFPLEIFLFTQRVDGLPDGLHHYDVRGHALACVSRGNLFPTLEPAFYTFPFVRDANLVMAFAAVFPRTQKKYGPRGYRYILLEAGHAAQNVCLAASELGLGTLCMGGFIDTRVNRLLGLRPTEEGVVYAVASGYSAESESTTGG
jgi:SagB-type dehydrogenase family enzyme